MKSLAGAKVDERAGKRSRRNERVSRMVGSRCNRTRTQAAVVAPPGYWQHSGVIPGEGVPEASRPPLRHVWHAGEREYITHRPKRKLSPDRAVSRGCHELRVVGEVIRAASVAETYLWW